MLKNRFHPDKKTALCFSLNNLYTARKGIGFHKKKKHLYNSIYFKIV